MQTQIPTKITTQQIGDWQLTCLPALADNYIWLITDLTSKDKLTIAIDPGASQCVLDYVNTHQLTLTTILLTHHHYDHTDGVPALVEAFSALNVYGPPETVSKGATHLINENSTLRLFGQPCSIIATPGHTLGHICYYLPPLLFTGDTLFSAGCGRLFEGTHEQMYHSLTKLSSFPDETLICAAHEYTLKNLEFAAHVFKDNLSITNHLAKIKLKQEARLPSLPSILALERQINPYILCENNDLRGDSIDKLINTTALSRFTYLRKLKDIF